jgi:hypothetical protein
VGAALGIPFDVAHFVVTGLQALLVVGSLERRDHEVLTGEDGGVAAAARRNPGCHQGALEFLGGDGMARAAPGRLEPAVRAVLMMADGTLLGVVDVLFVRKGNFTEDLLYAVKDGVYRHGPVSCSRAGSGAEENSRQEESPPRQSACSFHCMTSLCPVR